VTTELHTVLANDVVAPGILRMTVRPLDPSVTPGAGTRTSVLPGQFHMLKTLAPEPLLARPISIHEVDGDDLRFLYEVKGAGTQALADLVAGDGLWITGPCGNGFRPGDLLGRVLLVAGGIGIAPFPYLARVLHQAGKAQVTLAAGFRSQPYSLEDFAPHVPDIRVASEDGSAGVQGRVPVLFDPREFDVVVACGPVPMMRAVQAICDGAGTRCILSMEARMACGVGLCLGCTIRTTTGMRRVCIDGPVFPAEEVIFDAAH